MWITLRIIFRLAGILRVRLGWIALRRWVIPSLRSLSAWRKRLADGRLFPPFLFIALTDACNLRCRGCWIHARPDRRELSITDVQKIIDSGRSQYAGFYALLGGEPFLWNRNTPKPTNSTTMASPPDSENIAEAPIFTLLRQNRNCYFQIITNGMFLDEPTVQRLAECGNVTPLVSIDGPAELSDARRGPGSFDRAEAGCRRLGEAGLLYGVAITITGENLDAVLCDEFIEYWLARRAGYLWYYIYRPVGDDPAPELAVPRERMIEIRRRLLQLRRRHAIVIIDTYWNAAGEALCPAALGMGFQIQPDGSISPCPPLTFARENVRDHDGDLVRSVDESRFLRDFSTFCTERTRGCVILEHPAELAQFLREQNVTDSSGRDALSEIERSSPHASHHQPGEEIPENLWFYRMMKNHMFFGLGAYG